MRKFMGLYVITNSFRNLVVFSLVCLFSSLGFAQEWVARHNGPADTSDYAYAIAALGVEEGDCFADARNGRLEVYPNPCFGGAVVKYWLSENSRVSLRLYDISGRLIRSIYSGAQEKGYYEVEIEGDIKDSPYRGVFISSDLKRESSKRRG